jgi:tetratricopeptide (TPR) repeat protein
LPPAKIEPFKPSSGTLPDAANLSRTSQEEFPRGVETWLLVPLFAPDFSLPDQFKRVQSLAALRGKPALLVFWSESTADSRKNLDELEHFHARWAPEGLQLLAIHVEAGEKGDANGLDGPGRSYSFPMLQASPDVIAVYNLLFRQIYDRHRDMSVPIAFLVDPSGAVVKIYQGRVPLGQVEADFKNIPQSDAERLAKALPFPGLTRTYEFGRNYLSLGFGFFERGYFAEAEMFYRQAVRDDPQSADALYALGSACLQLQKEDEAREDFQRALVLPASYPGTIPNCWNNLGLLKARQGNTDAAILLFQKALRIDPQHSIALLNLGNAYRQKKDWPEAQQALERVMALTPDDPEANYSLGMVFAEQNNIEQASRYLEKALALRPVYPEALNNLGILYLRTRRPEDAIRSFEDSIRVAPDYDQAYLNLARVYVIEGVREKAKAVLRDLLKRHPGHAQAQAELQQLGE